jgi:hypothetical protein
MSTSVRVSKTYSKDSFVYISTKPTLACFAMRAVTPFMTIVYFTITFPADFNSIMSGWVIFSGNSTESQSMSSIQTKLHSWGRYKSVLGSNGVFVQLEELCA